MMSTWRKNNEEDDVNDDDCDCNDLDNAGVLHVCRPGRKILFLNQGGMVKSPRFYISYCADDGIMIEYWHMNTSFHSRVEAGEEGFMSVAESKRRLYEARRGARRLTSPV